MGDYDRKESDSEAALGASLLTREFRRYKRIAGTAEGLSVAPGSSLAGDRDAAPYNPLTDQIRNTLAVALDHLHGLQVSIEESGGMILAMSSFTLIRTAYEAIGTGLWLLCPTSRDERLSRSMRLTFENRRQVRSLQTGLGKPDPGFERMHLRLRKQMDTRVALIGAPLKPVDSVTSRLASVAELLPDLPFPPLTLWQMASGVAHGNSSMLIALLEREQVEPTTEPSADYKVTSGVVTIALFYSAALDMIEKLLTVYDLRSRGRNLP